MKTVIFLTLLFLNSTATSNENNNATPKAQYTPGPIQTFFQYEGLIAFNSLLAASDPQAFGAILTLLSPLSVSEKTTSTTRNITFGGVVSIGLYNGFELSNDNYSKNDIFKQNMIAFNLLTISAIITEKLTNDPDTSISITALDQSYYLSLNKKF